MIDSAPRLTGARKAAVMLMQLGHEAASKIFPLLGESEVTQITAEIVRAGNVRQEETRAIFDEFRTLASANVQLASGGMVTARQLLESAVGAERASEIMESLRSAMVKVPFEFLRHADPRQVLNFLSSEHTQTIALVLAHMDPEQSSMVLGGLPEDLQRDVSIRIATLEQASPEVIAQVESLLERRISSIV